LAHFQNNSSHKEEEEEEEEEEVLNAKRNENGKRGKGQDPTDRTTCGEPRTKHTTRCQAPVGENPFPPSPTPNMGALE
jgi:hypothetical protein